MPVPILTQQATPPVLSSATSTPLCLAVPQELWEEQRELFMILQRSYPACSAGPARDSSQALAWSQSGRSRISIVSGERPEQGAELIRVEPYVLVGHVTSPLDDVSLSWLRQVFEEGGRERVIVMGDGVAVRELLGLDHLASDAVHVSSWKEAKGLVAEDKRGLALLPWRVVDFHVRVLTIDGQRMPLEGLESYPYVRRWSLAGALDEHPEIRQALRESLVYEPGPLVSLVAVGDLMLGRGVGSLIAANSSYYPFLATQELTSQADVAFANLESPITSRGAPQGSIALRAHPQAVEGLTYAGFDVLSLANNHIDDYGDVGLLDTLDLLEQEGIAHVGAGRDVEEAHSPVVVEVQGLKIAFLAFNRIEPRYSEPEEGVGGAVWLEPETVYEEVRRAQDQVDIVVVSFHWGTEYSMVPSDFQQEVARRTVEAGADLVLGHHPHVIGSVAFLDEGFVAYSLGNFVFDQPFSVETMQGLVLHSLIDATGVKQVRLIPVQIEAGQPRLLPWPDDRPILADLFQVTESEHGLPTRSEARIQNAGRSAHLQVDWATELRDPVSGLQVSDLDGDGDPEVLVATGSAVGGGGVYAVSGDGTILWEFEAEDQVQDLSSGDLDGDGRDEVIAATGLMDVPGWVIALDGEGQLRWRYGVEASVQTVALADADGTAGLEVVAGEWGSFGDTVYLLDGDGNLRWKYQTDGSVNVVLVRDVDGDGRGEVIAGADDLYVLGSDGRLLWRHATAGYVNNLAVGELNSDDALKQIVAVTAYPGASVLALEGSGGLSWQHLAESSLTDVIIGDFCDDPGPEILAGALDGSIYQLNGYGVLRREHQGEPLINDLALADANGDGIMEVVAGTGDYSSSGGVYVADVVSGAGLASYEVPGWVSALDASDMDGDGEDEIVAGLGRGGVLVLGWTME